MPDALGWILGSGAAMVAVSALGAIGLLLDQATLRRLILPLVALAAGSLLGGALFHMIPAAVATLGNRTSLWIWVTAGFVAFFCFEQFLHYHHCHEPSHDHARPFGHLILFAGALHDFVEGLAVGGAFVVDIGLGLTAWVAAATHEVPQSLGDFGALVHAGWSRSRALLFNALSATGFLAGGLMAYLVSSRVDVGFLVPFAAGNFLYIAAADLVPEINRHEKWTVNVVHFLSLCAGLLLLLGVKLALDPY